MDVDGDEEACLDMDSVTLEEPMTDIVTAYVENSCDGMAENVDVGSLNGHDVSEPRIDDDNYDTKYESAHNSVQTFAPGPSVAITYKTFCKVILASGSGYSLPKDGSLCQVNIAILNLNNIEPSDVGYEVGENVVVMIGEGDTFIARQLDLCLQTMKQGEVCDIQVPRESECSASRVCDICSFRIHLIAVQESVASWQLLPEEKISRAAHHKEKGTALFQAGKPESAFRRFSKALKYLICCHPEESIPDQLFDTYSRLRCQCYSNMAACHMKLNHFNEVIELCSRALAIDSKNVKSMYRRAQAYMMINDIDSARSDLEAILELEPHNKAAVQLLAQVEIRQRQADSKLAVGLSKMFS